MALSTFNPGQLVDANSLNSNLRDPINFMLTGGALLRNGIILPFNINFDTPPTNWHKTDGTGGTQDLRDRMTLGSNGTLLGSQGGQTQQTLATHNSHVLSAPSHRGHTAFSSSHTDQFDVHQPFNNGFTQPVSDSHDSFPAHNISIAGDHPHTWSAGGPIDNTVHVHPLMNLMPPYKAASFFQKTTTPSVATPRTWTNGETPNASEFNIDLRDSVNNILGSIVPIGLMAYWGGNLADLPIGWQLADGTNGTLDMRDRFAIATGLTYGLGDAGGATTLVIGNHTNHPVVQPDTHANHPVGFSGFTHHSGPYGGSGGDGSVGTTSSFQPSGNHAWGVDAHGPHSSFSLNAHGAHGVISLLPPYRAYYIVQYMFHPTFVSPRTWTNGDVVGAGQLNTYIRDNLTSLLARLFPIGMVAALAYDAAMPTGFVQDPGSTNLWIIGAGLSYAVQASGGSTAAAAADHGAHVLNQPSHHQNHNVFQPAAHPFILFELDVDPFGSQFMSDGGHNFRLDVGQPDHHPDHAFSLDGPHAGHETIFTIPPYTYIQHIQRVA